MKAILISIQPKWVAKILNGEKTIEIRKTMPKRDLPIDVYIYCTKITRNKSAVPYIWEGKVVAKFTLNKVEDFGAKYSYAYKDNHFYEILKQACLSVEELQNYSRITREQAEKGKAHLYAWHIDNLEIFDEPKELSEFNTKQRIRYANLGFTKIKPLTRAPQSWCYVEV